MTFRFIAAPTESDLLARCKREGWRLVVAYRSADGWVRGIVEETHQP